MEPMDYLDWTPELADPDDSAACLKLAMTWFSMLVVLKRFLLAYKQDIRQMEYYLPLKPSTFLFVEEHDIADLLYMMSLYTENGVLVESLLYCENTLGDLHDNIDACIVRLEKGVFVERGTYAD
jgi:hypothetical protein